MKLTIVTVTYNSASVLPRLLAPLAGPDMPIIVVDNGSLDQGQTIAAAYPGVQVIKNRNTGYGRGANLGFAAATTPYVLLVNPDVVISKASIDAMLKALEANPQLGITSGRMYHTGGTNKCYEREYMFDASGLAKVDWVVGALMLIRTDALKKVGGFDENIFLFYEETDLCRRFAKAGYGLAVVRDAEAEHEAGTSSPPSDKVLMIKAWHSSWSKAYFHHKHFSKAVFFKKTIARVIRASSKTLFAMITGDRHGRIKNSYELKGTLAYLRGADAFENGIGRLT